MQLTRAHWARRKNGQSAVWPHMEAGYQGYGRPPYNGSYGPHIGLSEASIQAQRLPPPNAPQELAMGFGCTARTYPARAPLPP